MNRRHRSAQLAGRASVQLHTLIFFSGVSNTEEDAFVLDVEATDKSEPSIMVMVPRYGIEGRVRIPLEVDDSRLQRFPDEHKLVFEEKGKSTSIQVFDKVRVNIWVRSTEDHQRELIIDLAEPMMGVKREAPSDEPEITNKKKKQKRAKR